MFNEYVWNLYVNGEGKDIIEFFHHNFNGEFTKEYGDAIKALHTKYCPSHFLSNSICDQLKKVHSDLSQGLYYFEGGEYTIFSAMQYLLNELRKNKFTDKDIFEWFVWDNDISYHTTFFAIELPELFIPYYFKCNFNILEKIAQTFDIDLPALPTKRDYKGRFAYYGTLCEVLCDFRQKHNMTPYELYAFLYDFAPKYIGGIDNYIIKDIPAPKSAYFVGGDKDDVFLSEDSEIITPWQCNPDTVAGDNIVMYFRSPISAVDSVWRSVSVGFNDPFFYFYRCTYIANPQQINRISQKQLETDEVFKNLPIVRKNMQGINGVELRPSAYNRLLDLACSDLKRMDYIGSDDSVLSLSREKDVEDQLIKPLLSQLGYTDTEYKQQLYIEIGNHNHALIPDFVIHPVVVEGHQFADFLIEAKYSIVLNKQLDSAKTQARSYAKLLNAKYTVIISKEGIWITSFADDYTNTILAFSWEQMKNADNFYQVFKLIGNEKNDKDTPRKRRLSVREAEYLMFLDEE